MTRNLCSAAASCCALSLLFIGGCGHRTAPAPKATPVTATQRPLPEWAPRNPSPEFLRACQVLTPSTDEELAQFAKGDPARFGLVRRVSRTWSAAFDFFGTMSDEQIRRFVATKGLRMPAKSLSAEQRAALDAWFERWRTEMKGNGSAPDDWLVVLIKIGGRDDLSNVDVGFDGESTARRVHLKFWVNRADKKDASIQTDFAYLK